MEVTKDQARAFLQSLHEDNLRVTAHFKAVLGNYGLPYYPIYKDGYSTENEKEVANRFCNYLRVLAEAIEKE